MNVKHKLTILTVNMDGDRKRKGHLDSKNPIYKHFS